MVLGVPAAKLAPLLFKELTKPMIKYVKVQVGKNQYWRSGVLIVAKSKTLFGIC